MPDGEIESVDEPLIGGFGEQFMRCVLVAGLKDTNQTRAAGIGFVCKSAGALVATT